MFSDTSFLFKFRLFYAIPFLSTLINASVYSLQISVSITWVVGRIPWDRGVKTLVKETLKL